MKSIKQSSGMPPKPGAESLRIKEVLGRLEIDPARRLLQTPDRVNSAAVPDHGYRMDLTRSSTALCRSEVDEIGW